VLCSYKDKGEGLSNSVLEYMICSVPPVISRIGATTEIIDDGISGLLFEPENVNDLANKILILYEDIEFRRKIAENAKSKVLNKFALNVYINNYENLYSKLLVNQ
jgi:L-malate glycosyltransferase